MPLTISYRIFPLPHFSPPHHISHHERHIHILRNLNPRLDTRNRRRSHLHRPQSNNLLHKPPRPPLRNLPPQIPTPKSQTNLHGRPRTLWLLLLVHWQPPRYRRTRPLGHISRVHFMGYLATSHFWRSVDIKCYGV